MTGRSESEPNAGACAVARKGVQRLPLAVALALAGLPALASSAAPGAERLLCRFGPACEIVSGGAGACADPAGQAGAPAPLVLHVALLPGAEAAAAGTGRAALRMTGARGGDALALAAAHLSPGLRVLHAVLEEDGADAALTLSLHAEGPAWLSIHRPQDAVLRRGACESDPEGR